MDFNDSTVCTRYLFDSVFCLFSRGGYMYLHCTYTLAVELFPLGMGHCRPLCCWPLQPPQQFRFSPLPPLIGPAVEPWGKAGRKWTESHCHRFLPPSPSRQPLWLIQAVMWSQIILWIWICFFLENKMGHFFQRTLKFTDIKLKYELTSITKHHGS